MELPIIPSVCPGIFTKTVLRGCSKYKSLSHHLFTTSEKIWVCNFLKSCRGSGAIMADRYGIQIEVLDEWLTLFSQGEDLKPGYARSECPIDRIGRDKIREFIDVGQVMHETTEEYSARWVAFVREQEQQTDTRRKLTLIN